MKSQTISLWPIALLWSSIMKILMMLFIVLLSIGCRSVEYCVVAEGSETIDASFLLEEEAKEYVDKYSQFHDYRIIVVKR